MQKYVDLINSDENLNTVKPFLKNKKVYIVGGYLRDLFSGEKSSDLDIITVDENAEELSRNIANGINGHFIELDGINKIYRVVFEDKTTYTDIAQALDNNLETDLKRRDLTINSLCFDINADKFIDLTGSINDIQKGIIRGISEQNFADDPLRLLRIFRFYSKTGFKISDDLIDIAKKYAQRITEPAKERINVELMKMFEGKYCADALVKADECGLIVELFPIYKEVKKVPPNTHHHLPLFLHLIETVNRVQKYYENAPTVVKNTLNEIRFGTVKTLGYLKFAAFFHDIGKPSCWTIEEDTQRHRFIGHDNKGAELAAEILKDYKFSKKQTEFICNLIKYHIYPSGLVTAERTTEKTFMKFYRKTEGFTVELIILAAADRLSAQGPAVTKEMTETNLNNLKNLLKRYFEIKNELKPLPKLIDGNEIMRLYNIPQGKALGNLISEIKEAQISGDIQTKDDVLIFLNKKLK